MPKNIYGEINLHITWHTKLSDPVITGTLEARLHHFLTHTVPTRKVLSFILSTAPNQENITRMEPQTSDWSERTVKNRKAAEAA